MTLAYSSSWAKPLENLRTVHKLSDLEPGSHLKAGRARKTARWGVFITFGYIWTTPRHLKFSTPHPVTKVKPTGTIVLHVLGLIPVLLVGYQKGVVTHSSNIENISNMKHIQGYIYIYSVLFHMSWQTYSTVHLLRNCPRHCGGQDQISLGTLPFGRLTMLVFLLKEDVGERLGCLLGFWADKATPPFIGWEDMRRPPYCSLLWRQKLDVDVKYDYQGVKQSYSELRPPKTSRGSSWKLHILCVWKLQLYHDLCT